MKSKELIKMQESIHTYDQFKAQVMQNLLDITDKDTADKAMSANGSENVISRFFRNSLGKEEQKAKECAKTLLDQYNYYFKD